MVSKSQQNTWEIRKSWTAAMKALSEWSVSRLRIGTVPWPSAPLVSCAFRELRRGNIKRLKLRESPSPRNLSVIMFIGPRGRCSRYTSSYAPTSRSFEAVESRKILLDAPRSLKDDAKASLGIRCVRASVEFLLEEPRAIFYLRLFPRA